MPPSSFTLRIEIISREEISSSQWKFYISKDSWEIIISDHTKLKVNTLNGGIVDVWLPNNDFSIYDDSSTDPFGSLWDGIHMVGNPDKWYLTFSDPGNRFYFRRGPNNWTEFLIVTTPTPPPSNIPPIILQWSNAFDAENNIVRYELSYKTSGDWISLPYVVSNLTSGSYTFTPLEQVNHTFRIRIVDSFNAFSEYKYYDYIIVSDYKISDLPAYVGDTALCSFEPNSTFNSSIFLSATTPANDVVVYTNSGKTNKFNGSDQYWLIKSPGGILHSCRITGLGVIQEVYLCGSPPPPPQIQTTTDVIIGTQTWQLRNLNVSTYSDETPIPEVTTAGQWAGLTTGAWCRLLLYSGDGTGPANEAKYGKLYNWYAVAGIHNAASLTDPSLRKKLAPIGYHIPSNAEWLTLTTFLGGTQPIISDVNVNDIYGTAGPLGPATDTPAGKMKQVGYNGQQGFPDALWSTPNTGATNDSGFTALPGGYREDNGIYFSSDSGAETYLWSSDISNFYIDRAKFIALFHDKKYVRFYVYDKNYGMSVRCIKD